MKRNRFWLFEAAFIMAAALLFIGCPNSVQDDSLSSRVTLTAGPAAVEVAASATTANVTFTSASGLSLSEEDFTIDFALYDYYRPSVTGVTVDGDTATVSVSLPANPSLTSAMTYTVSIASGSAKIMGSGRVIITQAMASDTRVTLTAGPAVEVAASATTANVTFTGTNGLSLSEEDFTIGYSHYYSYRPSVTGVTVDGDTATVSVSFSANAFIVVWTCTVSIASGSTKIMGSATVAITQAGQTGSADITIGFNYSEIMITGDDGSNVISKSGNYGQTTLSLSATDYTDVRWYVDGSKTAIQESPVTLNASDYTAELHSITFTGVANGRRYSSRPIPFTVWN